MPMKDEEKRTIELSIADDTVKDLRLDRFIAENLKLFPRNQISHHRLEAWVNQKQAKMSKKVSVGDRVELQYYTTEPVSYQPEEMQLDIIFENQDVMVVNKSQGMVVHPAAGNRTGTLVQGLLYHCEELRQTYPSEELRPGIVHRLDKATSGVLIAAKHPRAQDFLASQFRRKKTEKKYYAVVKGRLSQNEGTIETNILRDRRNRKKFTVSSHNGKHAVTHFKVLKTWESYSLLALKPVTGRTHQLRVHMTYLHHPILGDDSYGRKDSSFPDATLMLHAYSLTIRLPGEDELRRFRAPLPKKFKETLKAISDRQEPGL